MNKNTDVNTCPLPEIFSIPNPPGSVLKIIGYFGYPKHRVYPKYRVYPDMKNRECRRKYPEMPEIPGNTR